MLDEVLADFENRISLIEQSDKGGFVHELGERMARLEQPSPLSSREYQELLSKQLELRKELLLLKESLNKLSEKKKGKRKDEY